jgi:nicotinate-nucleotide adenylyltransferase
MLASPMSKLMHKKSIAVFGSAFNPVHYGHLDVLEQIRNRYDEIWLVPSYCHAFDKRMAPYADRLHMTGLAAQSIEAGDFPQLVVSDLERKLAELKPEGSPIYTFDLLAAIEQQLGDAVELSFVVGPDNARPEVWRKFHRADEILKRWSRIVVEERLPVRSTAIRKALIENDAGVGQWLPNPVHQYIVTRRLYTET